MLEVYNFSKVNLSPRLLQGLEVIPNKYPYNY